MAGSRRECLVMRAATCKERWIWRRLSVMCSMSVLCDGRQWRMSACDGGLVMHSRLLDEPRPGQSQVCAARRRLFARNGSAPVRGGTVLPSGLITLPHEGRFPVRVARLGRRNQVELRAKAQESYWTARR
jgi:hypothetical protein